MLFWAILISAMAGLVSIVGMVALFPAGGLMIIAIMALLESSKLLVAGWAHANWNNPLAPRWLKIYKTLAIVVLMLITSIGIYGFLSKAHIEQGAPTADVQINIDQKQLVVDQLVAQRDQLVAQQQQINSTIGGYIQEGRASGASQFMRQQRTEQRRIETEIATLNEQIAAGNAELVPLRQDLAGSEVKLGPLKYVADLFGWEDPEAAVKLIIVMLMFAFDPLAVAMMISGSITIGEYLKERREKSLVQSSVAEPVVLPEPDNQLTQPEPEITSSLPFDMTEAEMQESLSPPKPKMGGVIDPLPNIFESLEQKVIDDIPEKPDNREMLVSILENDPALMAEVVEAITSAKKEETAQPDDAGWLRHRPDASQTN